MGNLNWNRLQYRGNIPDIAQMIDSDLKKKRRIQQQAKFIEFAGIFKYSYKRGNMIFFVFENIINRKTKKLYTKQHHFMFSSASYIIAAKKNRPYTFKAIPKQKQTSKGLFKYFTKYHSFEPI